MDPESLRVSMTVRGSCHTDLSFVLPLVYFDNPVDSLTGPLVPEIAVTDAEGTAVRTSVVTRTIGPVDSRILSVPEGTAYPVTLSYRPRVNRVERRKETDSLPPVYLSARDGFVIGAHLFAVPYEPRLTDLWRAPRDITLSLSLGDTISVTGVPIGSASCPNAYSLIFVQMAFGAEMLAGGSGGGRSFGLYGLDGYRPSAERLQEVSTDFALILDSLAPIYAGPEDPEPYPVFFRNAWGGLEGTHSFTCLHPDPEDRATVAMVLAHEMIHDAVGIRCGEHDDPWWKEGVTTYLGWAAVGRLGLATIARCRQELIEEYDTSTAVGRYVPSSSAFRTHIFTDGFAIAYGKGAQIAMCLDLELRRTTNNRVRLDEATAALCRAYEGGAFTRGALIAHFRQYDDADITPILAEYADRAAAIPGPVLDSVFDALDSLGAFGSGGVGRRGRTAVPWNRTKW